MKNPLYSIITICLNNEKGISKTAESVSVQTYKDFEWIVVDGGSTDNSVSVAIRKLSPAHLISETDDGIYHAMNKGISRASGDYFLFLNAGDWFYSSTVLEDVSRQLEGDLVAGWLNVIYPERYKKASKIRRLDLQDVRKKFLYHRTLHHQATFIRKTLFEKYGWYDQEYKIYGDWDFFLRVINNGANLNFIKLCVANYTFEGISSISLGSKENNQEVKRIRQNHFSVSYRLKRYFVDTVEKIFNIRGY